MSERYYRITTDILWPEGDLGATELLVDEAADFILAVFNGYEVGISGQFVNLNDDGSVA
jgi:hypothetical protein